MSLFFSNKLVRLLLAVTVSVWMAGGCIFGCGATAAAVVNDSVPTVEAGESCHAAQSHHHCCATQKARKRVVRNLRQPDGIPTFMPAPRGMMNECPLVLNATAATAKSSTHMPDPGRVPVAVLPSFEKQTATADNISIVSFLPNRGPTHLRCCVFLI